MKKYLIAFVLLFVPSMVMGAVQPADFAYGMPISLREGGAVYRLILPIEVYQTVTQGDLGDLRVFNKAKSVVPYMLHRPKVKNKIHENKMSLPIFPLYGKSNQTTQESLSVRFEKDEDGTILDIRSNDGPIGEVRKLMGYIIDASAYEAKIDALDIIWQKPAKSFVTEVYLEQSTDLTYWTSLVNRTTLARMNFQGHHIIKERMPLPSKSARYIRLLWHGGHDGVEVKSILAVQRRGEPGRLRQRKIITGELIDGPDESAKVINAYEYDTSARIPVDRIRLRFVEKNTFLKATLFSRSDEALPWRFRLKGTFYNLHFDSASLIEDTVSVEETTDRYWRVEIARDALGDPNNIPEMELGWLPHDLLFVARGEGPFLLAYGSAIISEGESENGAVAQLDRFLKKDKQDFLKEADVLPPTALGGPDMLLPAPPPMPWRKWVLWGVLVIGVILIAWMALSLGRGMNKEKV